MKWLEYLLLLTILAVVGCGKSHKEKTVAQNTSEPTTANTPATTPVTTVAVATKPENPTFEPMLTNPSIGPSFLQNPPPMVPTTPKVDEPVIEVAPIPAVAQVNPPVNPAPMNPVPMFPPKVDPQPEPKVDPKPEIPQPTLPKQPEPMNPMKEKPAEYPKLIEGRDLTLWLKEITYDSAQLPLQRDAQARETAVKVIPAFGPVARKPALNPLRMVVAYDSDPTVRIAAMALLAQMGPEELTNKDGSKRVVHFARLAMKEIRERLKKTQPGSVERLYIARAISAMGPDGAEAIPDLISICRDVSFETRIAVTEALGRVGVAVDDKSDPSELAVKTINETMLVDVCTSVRLEAIQSLLVVGIPKIRNPAELAKFQDIYVRPIAARIKPEKGKGVAEKDKSVIAWLLALHTLYEPGNAKLLEENLKQISQMIRYPDGYQAMNVRINALNALSVLGPKAFPVIADVIDALTYEDPMVVAAAITCLASMGRDAEQSVPYLEKIKAGSKDPKKPADASPDWKPDQSLRKLAEDAIQYIRTAKKPKN